MFLRPELAALDCDDLPQRRAQDRTYARFAAWRESAANTAWGASLERFGSGAELADCRALAALFADDPAPAAALVDGLVATGIAALASEPLGHVPLRHGGDAGQATLVLGQAGDAALSLVARSGAALAAAPQPVSASFSPSRQWLRVIAGSAEAARIVRSTDGALTAQPLRLTPCTVLSRDALEQALQFRAISGTLVTLVLNRRDCRVDVAREYALADGSLVRQSACHPRDSRHELMAALLGRMERRDAAPTLAALAISQTAGRAAEPLRWQALREALTLDTRAGFAALSALAETRGDPLASAAQALRAQLVAAHPALEELAPCPA